MTCRGVIQGTREVLLTFGALLGVLCMVATVAGVAFDVRPLVFRSGSMHPAIHTGDLAVARTVHVTDLRRGDIVSVVNAEGQRVTHRLVDVSRQGDARQLTLKGDANRRADTEIYSVDRAEKVWFRVPKAGYVVDAAMSPVGLFVLGLYVAGVFALVLRRRPGGPDDTPASPQRRAGARRATKPKRSQRAARTATVLLAGVSLIVATPAIAAGWVDPVPIAGTVLTTPTVVAPTTMTCATSGNNAVVTFTNSNPVFSYAVEHASSQTGATESTTYIGPSTGATNSHTVSSGLLGGLGGAIYVRVYSIIRVGSSYVWKSSDFRGRRLNVSLIFGTVSCSTEF